jgi:hypothetical protein
MAIIVMYRSIFRSNITDDFSAKMLLELTALENDIEQLSDAEKKMEVFLIV